MSSSWRVNDTVAYDCMQERHTMLTHLLVSAARAAGDTETEMEIRNEMMRWKSDTLAVDGGDRRAIDEHASLIDARIEALARH
ncbi:MULTISPECIES: hypothetical protein [unclassified Microbacterium]|uniref:hypothetical protein n=1 Tax=unclassified Microbacterium TaxID=2609290 RepID=UPI003867CB8F